jgi:CBS domain-containing protein
MKVAEILEAKGHDVVITLPSATVVRLAERLRVDRIGALVVTNDGRHVEGVVTEREIVHAIARHGADALELHASDVMSRSPRRCSPDDRVRDVMVTMTNARVRHLLVMEGDQLRGIVSIGDVVKSVLDDADLEVNVLRDAYLGHR